MNKASLKRQLASTEQAANFVDVRTNSLLLKLKGAQAQVDLLANQERLLISSLFSIMEECGGEGKLIYAEKKPARTVWLLVAPNYAGADRAVVNYREIFAEKVTSSIMAGDVVFCVGESAIDLAKEKGYAVPFESATAYADPKERARTSWFLSQVIMSHMQSDEYSFFRVLCLSSNEELVRTVLPVKLYEPYAKEERDAKGSFKCPLKGVQPDLNGFVVSAITMLLASVCELALAESDAFRMRVNYHAGTQALKTLEKRGKFLRAKIASMTREKSLDDLLSFAANKRAVAR